MLASIDAELTHGGLSVRDQFLTPSQIGALADCARLRRARGDFGAARIGGDRSLQRRKDIRGDSTCWIIPPLWPAEQALLGELERLRLELNREAMLGLFELELHYAWYSPGTGYARHVDQPQGCVERRVSLVLYLNQDWMPAAGGSPSATALRGESGAYWMPIRPRSILPFLISSSETVRIVFAEIAKPSPCAWLGSAISVFMPMT